LQNKNTCDRLAIVVNRKLKVVIRKVNSKIQAQVNMQRVPCETTKKSAKNEGMQRAKNSKSFIKDDQESREVYVNNIFDDICDCCPSKMSKIICMGNPNICIYNVIEEEIHAKAKAKTEVAKQESATAKVQKTAIGAVVFEL